MDGDMDEGYLSTNGLIKSVVKLLNILDETKKSKLERYYYNYLYNNKYNRIHFHSTNF